MADGQNGVRDMTVPLVPGCDGAPMRTGRNLPNPLEYGQAVRRQTTHGKCDPNDYQLRQGAERWRYTTGYLQLAYDAPNTRWIIAPGQQLRLYSAGVGDPGVTQGLPGGATMSEVETDGFKGGALADANQVFQIRGLGIAVGIPFFQAAVPVPNATFTKSYNGVAGQGIWQLLMSAVYENFSVTAVYNQAAPNYNLGPLNAWPAHASTQLFGSLPQVGTTFGAGSIIPIEGELGAGAQDARTLLNVYLQTSSQYGVEIVNPFAQVFTTAAFVPVRCFAYGFQDPDCSQIQQCAVVSPEQVQQQVYASLAAAMMAFQTGNTAALPQELQRAIAAQRNLPAPR